MHVVNEVSARALAQLAGNVRLDHITIHTLCHMFRWQTTYEWVYMHMYVYMVAVCIWARVKYYISQLRFLCVYVCVFVRSALRAISSNQQVCAFSPKHAHCSKTPQTPENPITLSCVRLPYPPYIVSEFCANKISLLSYSGAPVRQTTRVNARASSERCELYMIISLVCHEAECFCLKINSLCMIRKTRISSVYSWQV